MKTTVAEIAPNIYRLSTFVPNVGPTGFTFNQFLIDADEPLLFHYGQRSLFPLIVEAVKTVIPLDKLRWTTCSHVEGDESGALNQWLAAAPNATPAHGQLGCNIWLADMADRFHLLSYGLAFVLMFIGVKMLLIDIFKIPVFLALGVVAALIAASIAASLLWRPRHESRNSPT